MFASFLMSGVRVVEVVGWRSLILRLTHPMESLLVGAELALIQKNITIDIVCQIEFILCKKKAP